MAFNNLLRALGFRSGSEEFDELSDYPSALPVQPQFQNETAEAALTHEDAHETQPAETADTVAETTSAADDAPSESDTAFPLTIFDSLLEVFNEAQPDFIRKCLDMNAQRRYLYDTVDISFREYISKIRNGARADALREFDAEHRRMLREIDSLREKLEDHSRSSDELKAQKISAARQKRTYTERIQQLEQQVASAAAEKEQYDLEIKSLLNKLKVQKVAASDSAEIKDLRDRLADANRQITALNASAAKREAAEKSARKEIETLRTRVGELTASLKEAEVKTASPDNSDTRNALNNRVIEAEATMKAAEERMLAAEKRARELHARIDELNKINKKLEENARKKVDPATPVTEVNVAPFEMLPVTQPVYAEKTDTAVVVSSTTGSVVAEPAAEVAAETVEPQPDKAPSGRKRRGRKKNMPRISAIDESMDSTEWLVGTPPEGAMLKIPVASDPEFGYQEPPKKPRMPENDAQMLLF